MTIEVRPQPIPEGLLPALERRRGRYTNARYLYHSISLDSGLYVGVFGDGPNGSYEWFIWDRGKLRRSDKGYGADCWALRDVLIECREEIDLTETLAGALIQLEESDK